MVQINVLPNKSKGTPEYRGNRVFRYSSNFLPQSVTFGKQPRTPPAG